MPDPHKKCNFSKKNMYSHFIHFFLCPEWMYFYLFISNSHILSNWREWIIRGIWYHISLNVFNKKSANIENGNYNVVLCSQWSLVRECDNHRTYLFHNCRSNWVTDFNPTTNLWIDNCVPQLGSIQGPILSSIYVNDQFDHVLLHILL